MNIEARRLALQLQESEIQAKLDTLDQIIKEGRYNRAQLLALVRRLENTVSMPSLGEGMSSAASLTGSSGSKSGMGAMGAMGRWFGGPLKARRTWCGS